MLSFFCGFGFSSFFYWVSILFSILGLILGIRFFFPAFLKWILGHLVHLTSFSFTAETVMLELISLLLTLADFFFLILQYPTA